MASTTPPVPPPPPGPNGGVKPKASSGYLLFNSKIIGEQGSQGQTETKQISEEEFVEQVYELVSCRCGDFSRGCGEEEQDMIVVVVLVPLNNVILQNGPMCGIVALAEAIEIVKGKDGGEDGTLVTPKEILDDAIQQGFTKQGELFSINAMGELAEKFGKFEQSRISCTEGRVESLKEFVEHILDGYPILVPYDADFNHSPSLRKGHAAHWAVVHGLAASLPSSCINLFTQQPEYYKVLKSSPELIIVQPKRNTKGSSMQMNNICYHIKNLHVIAHQGKSFRTGLWKYNDLIESNQNLKQVAPKIVENSSEFVVDNIIEGLCSKILLLK